MCGGCLILPASQPHQLSKLGGWGGGSGDGCLGIQPSGGVHHRASSEAYLPSAHFILCRLLIFDVMTNLITLGLLGEKAT